MSSDSVAAHYCLREFRSIALGAVFMVKCASDVWVTAKADGWRGGKTRSGWLGGPQDVVLSASKEKGANRLEDAPLAILAFTVN